MKNIYFKKAIGIVAIFMCLMFLLMMISTKIQERKLYSNEVKIGVESTHGKAQVAIPPYLLINYTHTLTERYLDKESKEYKYRQRSLNKSKIIRANYLNIETNLQSEYRHIGIYKYPVYKALNKVEGDFKFDKNYGLNSLTDKLISAHILIGASDLRGWGSPAKIELFNSGKNKPQDIVNFSEIDVAGANESSIATVDVSKLLKKYDGEVSFNTFFTVNGSEYFSWLPIADLSVIHMKSNWMHPSFFGLQSPSQRKISDSGFSATWKSNFIASSQTINCFTKNYIHADRCLDADSALSVRFVEPVDIHLKNYRSNEYGYLFILLTFLAFILIEVIKKLKIHPVNYFLVGVALTTFFLLLLGLSEHLSFELSYLISSFSCIILITAYLYNVLKSKNLLLGFAFGLSALYAMLYVILLSEDYAMLMGALLVFAALAITMMITRKINWYELNNDYAQLAVAADKE